MKLDKKHKVSDVQRKFNKKFPYLKIEFYKTPFNSTESTSSSRIQTGNSTLGQCILTNNSELLNHTCIADISPDTPIFQLEQEWWEKYGLSIQVFRYLDNLWIETGLSRTWTLEQQNNAGEQFNNPKPIK